MIIWDIDYTAFSIMGYSVRWYSLCWCAGLALAYYIVYRAYKHQNIRPELFEPLFLYCFLGVLIGARLGHCLLYEPEYFVAHPLEIFVPAHKGADGSWKCTGYTGLSSHGGILGVMIALCLYCRRTKMHFLHVIDNLTLAVPFTGCFIRLGNLMNSEIVGKYTDSDYGFVFVLNGDVAPRHPAQLYEAVAYFLVGVGSLLLYRWVCNLPRCRPGTGFLLGYCLTAVFVFRFFVEYIKEVQEPWELSLQSATGLDQGQLLSLPFVAAGLYLLWRSLRPAVPLQH